jgi:DNA mismatch repair protein MutS
VETANILNHATSRSLVILDEIGRGTSTYDGLAIAQAVAEHLHNHPNLGCKTLFATHYHELTALARYLPRVRNEQVMVTEEEGGVVFLHRIAPGSADRSYGVHVAQLAGMPRPLVQRAWELLAELEQANGISAGAGRPRGKGRARRGAPQLSLSSVTLQQVREELMKADVNGLTPLQALNLLYQLQEKAKESGW